MLSKKNRLTRREIEELKKGNRFVLQGQFFGLVFQKQAGVKKFALILSNKIAPKAVSRNKIKRLFYKAVKNKLFDHQGLFMFLAKKSCATANLEEFEKEAESFRSKIS